MPLFSTLQKLRYGINFNCKIPMELKDTLNS